MTGRIDVHSHLLPAVDDGCSSVEESIACAQQLVAAGYTHAFCTPHVWTSFPDNSIKTIPTWTNDLRRAFDEADVPLSLLPGGEVNLHSGVMKFSPDYIVSMGLGGKYLLVDMWTDRLPKFFEPTIRWLQEMGLTIILAHPERMRAVQDDPGLADVFTDMGILLQGNLQCFSDKPAADTRRVVEQYLAENRYFLLGSDTHNPQSMDVRMNGLKRAIELAGEETIDRLTIHNPRLLLNSR